MAKFKNRNGALQKSNRYHGKRLNPDFGGRHSNCLTADYHGAVLGWQLDNHVIMPKKMRKKVYKKTVLDVVEGNG